MAIFELNSKKCIYASANERFSRIKGENGFPFLALQSAISFCKITPQEIRAFAYSGTTYPSEQTIEDFLESSCFYGTKRSSFKLFKSFEKDHEEVVNFKNDLFSFQFCQTDSIESKIKMPQIYFYNHHEAHAYTAFSCIGSFKNTNADSIKNKEQNEFYAITADGRGDGDSLVIWKLENQKITRKVSFCELRSLGQLYSQITYFLGFTPNKHEGKITGLAAFGKKTDLCEKLGALLSFENGKLLPSADFVAFGKPFDLSFLHSLCDGFSKEDIAFAIQFVLEKRILEIISFYVPQNATLCAAGGVFANVKLNQKIKENREGKFYIFPEMGDGGIAFGAALAAIFEASQTLNFKTCFWENMLLGPSFTFSKTNLNGFKVQKFTQKNEFLEEICARLCKNEILGAFFGRMEFGPRALGSRSIIAAPKNGANEAINARLHRTEFMPFAPFSLKECADKLYTGLENDPNARFMTMCYVCSPLMQKQAPACVHIDKTARPQIVEEKDGLYYEILQKYFEKTGCASLINTSFNNHEEPIVCTPDDALNALKKNCVDAIITNDLWIISK